MIRMAMLGMGERGRQRIQCLAALPGVSVELVTDREESARRWVKERYPAVETVAEARKALADLSTHAVILALPAGEQAGTACQAMASGKHCLLEWPPATSLSELHELQAFSRERKRVCATSLPLLFHPAAVRIRELIEQGELGRLFYVSAQNHRPISFLIEQHVTWSLAVEEIALILFWLGETPRRVQATGFYFLNHRADTVALHLEFLSGRQARVEVGTLDAQPVREFSVVGSRRSVRLDLIHPQSPLYLHTPIRKKEPQESRVWGSESRSLALPELNPLQEETCHFLESLGQGRAPLADLARVEDVFRVLLAADLSLRYDGAYVDVARQTVQVPMGWRVAA